MAAHHSCRCGKNAYTETTCFWCGTGTAPTITVRRQPRYPAIPTLRRTRDHRPWTAPMIQAAIRRWHRETGRTPRLAEWERAGAWWPSARTVLRFYGTWKAAMFAAGLQRIAKAASHFGAWQATRAEENSSD